MIQNRKVITLPNGEVCIELETIYHGGYETSSLYSYHEQLNLETDLLALGSKIDVSEFGKNWCGKNNMSDELGIHAKINVVVDIWIEKKSLSPNKRNYKFNEILEKMLNGTYTEADLDKFISGHRG